MPRDLHFRLSISEYEFLKQLAAAEEQPLSIVLRRLIRGAMRSAQERGTTSAPASLTPNRP